MDLSKILSIAGKGGLFKVVSQAKSAVIVESLTEGKRFPAFAHDKISSLEEISVYSTGDDLPLKEVLLTFYRKLEGKPGPDAKGDAKTLKAFFKEMIPEYDQERVYISDMKKIISWYNLLLEHQMIDDTPTPTEENTTQEIDTDGNKEETTGPESDQV
jgi:hypothetical protein